MDICGQFEKRVSITGRDNGATGAEMTEYLLEWVEKEELKKTWESYIQK